MSAALAILALLWVAGGLAVGLICWRQSSRALSPTDRLCSRMDQSLHTQDAWAPRWNGPR